MTMTDNPPVSEYFENCPIGRIHPDPINPRTHVDIDDDFTASVAAGIIEPLIVRPDPTKATLLGEPEDFLIVAGERRHAAATAAELETVPVIVRHDLADDADALEAMIIENGHRSDLPPLDEARAFATLVEKGRSQREIARAVGREQGTVSKRLSLLKLPTRAQQLLDERRITIQTALGMTGLIKDNGRLSKVLDFAAGGRDDHDIAQYTFRLLQDVKVENDRAKQAKAIEKRLTELRAGDLEEKTEDDLDGQWEECDADDENATIFVAHDSWDGSLDIGYYRPRSEAEEAELDQTDRTDTGDAGNAEWEARRARENEARDARSSLTKNLVDDGYPGNDIAIPYILRMTLEDAFDRDTTDSIIALLDISIPDDTEDEYEAQRDAVRNYPDLVRVAFANALDLGASMRSDPAKRVHLKLLADHGYACDLPEERALFGDEVPDGNYEDESADRLVGEEEPVTPAKVGTDIPDAELHDTAENEERDSKFGTDWVTSTDNEGKTPAAAQTVSAAPEPNGSAAPEPNGSAATDELAEPFKAYNAFPVKSILNIINNPDTDTQRLQAVVNYETANRADTKILDAARARLDALAVAS